MFRSLVLWCLFSSCLSFDGINPKTLREVLQSVLPETNSTLTQCKNATSGCIHSDISLYLEHAAEALKSFDVSQLIRFPRNNNSYTESDETNEVDGDVETSRKNMSPLEELGKKFSNFIYTHDIEINLPDTLFESNVLQISPRAAKGKEKGIMAQFKILSKKISKGKPRIFFKIKKIGEKIKHAVLALIIFFGLAKILISFLLPLITGVATAKKILVKVLLFVFPFLAFFFRLCPFTPYGSKLHHHHHHISHAHHVPHTPSYLYHDLKQHEHHAHHSDIITAPDYHSEGPAFTNDLISHRVDPSGVLPNVGQGQLGGVHRVRNKIPFNRPLTPAEIEIMVKEAEKEALLKARLQQERLKVQAENKRLQEEIKLQLLRQESLKAQVANLANSGKINHLVTNGITNSLIPPKPPSSIHPKNMSVNVLQPHPNNMKPSSTFQLAESHNIQKATYEDPIQKAAAITYDPFYSPILEKVEKILNGLGIVDENCRERIICSMYKNPTKWSPFSNLISVELSRDAKELQKPIHPNAAVIKFHRYVQAARDGQDQRNCMNLYSSCAISTER